MRLEPEALRVRADLLALFILEEGFQPAQKVVSGRRSRQVPDVVRAVVVHAVEVVRAFDQGDVLGVPARQALAQLLGHRLRVAPVVDRVREPGYAELELALAGGHVGGGGRVVGLDPVACGLFWFSEGEFRKGGGLLKRELRRDRGWREDGEEEGVEAEEEHEKEQECGGIENEQEVVSKT